MYSGNEREKYTLKFELETGSSVDSLSQVLRPAYRLDLGHKHITVSGIMLSLELQCVSVYTCVCRYVRVQVCLCACLCMCAIYIYI